MAMKNGRWIDEVVIVVTKDLKFIEKHCCDLYPNCVWIDEGLAAGVEEIYKWLKDNFQEELKMLSSGDIDYILVEYDL